MTARTLVIDRTFKGVGRVKRATGTTDPRIRRRYNRMLDVLADEGRLDLLRAIRDGRLSFVEVHDAYQRKALDELPTAETASNLSTAMQTWIDGLVSEGPTAEVSAKHKVSLGQSRKYFEREAPKAAVADIARVLEKLRDSLGKEHPRSFNLARSAALAFVRQTLKKSHPLWLACAAVEPRKVKKATKVSPLTPDEARTYFPAPETDPVDAIAWGMMTTGMGPKEYWGDWKVDSDRVRIYGTKRAGRLRDVPLTWTPAAPALHDRTFADKVRDRTVGRATPYDLRRTFANWMEAAGIPRTRRKLYMGHGAKDVTDLYERHEVEGFLAADARTLRTFLGFEPPHTKGHTMTPHNDGGA